MATSASHLSSEVVVQWLDPEFGRPIKTWKFSNQPLITIGRANDRDVEITDVYVSRHHASLVFQEGQWLLQSLGRNGVTVENQLIADSIPVPQELKFRLGPSGPTVHFQTAYQAVENLATISFAPGTFPVFQLDETKLNEEVSEIVAGDYFQTLQQKAKQLRQQRGAN